MFKKAIDLGAPSFGPALDHLMHLKGLPATDCTDTDVRTVLGAFSLDDLRRLDGAFTGGQVVRRVFHAGGGRGCLLFHLNNAIVSFGAQSQYFAQDSEVFRASQALIAAWDSDALSEGRVRTLVTEAIQIREKPRGTRDPWQASLADIEAPEPCRIPDTAPNRAPACDERRRSEHAKANMCGRVNTAIGVL